MMALMATMAMMQVIDMMRRRVVEDSVGCSESGTKGSRWRVFQLRLTTRAQAGLGGMDRGCTGGSSRRAKGGPDQKMCSNRMKKQPQSNITTMATQAAVPGWSLTDQRLAGGWSRGLGIGPGATNSGRAQRST
jgi:hypothetical protein